MWNTRKNRIIEVLIIVVVGAIVSILNTLWLRNSLLVGIEKIANTTEKNIVNNKVTDISTKMHSSN